MLSFELFIFLFMKRNDWRVFESDVFARMMYMMWELFIERNGRAGYFIFMYLRCGSCIYVWKRLEGNHRMQKNIN